MTVSAAYGVQAVEFGEDYSTWNLGVSYALTDNFSGDLRFHDTDIDNCEICEGRFVATIKAVFP